MSYRLRLPGKAGGFTVQKFVTNESTREFTSGPNAFRYFLVTSNDIMTPEVLMCPPEIDHVGVHAKTFGSARKLTEIPFASNSGDHSITNGTSIKNGVLELNTNSPAGWTSELHNNRGNAELTDGNVQQLNNIGLRSAVTNTGVFTNRLQMPMLTP